MKKGFTIVEIIIVVIVIGILAGITVLGYGSWRERTAITTVKNDLIAADVVMKGAQDRDTGFPTTLPSNFEPSDGVTLILKPGSNATFYCLEATTTGKPGVTFFLDNDKNKQPAEGTCTMPYSPPATPPVVAGFTGGDGFAVHPLTDYAYYSTSIGSPGLIRKVPLIGGTPETVITSPTSTAVRNMVFDSTGKLYVIGARNVYKIDTETLTSQLVISGIPGNQDPRGLYLDGDNTLYIGGSESLFRYTFSTSTLTTLFSGSTSNYAGIAKNGEYLYLLKYSNEMARYNLTTNQMTPIFASAPVSGVGAHLTEMNGKLYVIRGSSIYALDIATATWSVARSDIRQAGCSVPSALGKKYGYLFYFGRINPAATSCTGPTGGFGIHTLTP